MLKSLWNDCPEALNWLQSTDSDYCCCWPIIMHSQPR